MLAALPSPACLLDRQGIVLSLNIHWQALAGLSGDDGSQAWLQLVEPADRYAALSALNEVSSGIPAALELRLRGRTGDARWHLVHLSPYAGDTLLCIATDIDGIRRREAVLEARASMQSQMLDVSVDCIKLISPSGHVMHMNKAGCRALGVPEDSPFGMLWLELLPEDVRAQGRQAIADALSGKIGRFPGRSVIAGQEPQHWDNSLTAVMDANGGVNAILVVSREVTGERAAVDALRQSEERLTMAANVGGLGIWDYDIASDTMICDDNWYRIVGLDPDKPIASIAEFRPYIHPEDADRATEVSHTASELIAKNDDYRITFRIIRPDGELRWLRSAAALQEHDGVPFRATGFIVDVTESVLREQILLEQNRRLKLERESLARLSAQDALTGVANRRELDDRLSSYWLESRRTGVPLTIVMIDVDHFKQYNDTYGHIAGDTVLRQIAGALLSLARSTDLVARYGGEEFLMALPGVVNPAPILDRINQVVREMAISHSASSSGFVTVSTGCAIGDDGYVRLEDAVNAADIALYEAKQGGRDQYVIAATTNGLE